jgi:hypothetical protein
MAGITNNALVTPKIFARLALFNLRSMNNTVRNMSTEVTPEFAKKAMKVGDTVQVRRPYRFLVTEGLEWQPQPLQDTVMPVTVDTPLGIHFQWDTIEKTLSLREANELYAKPAAISMAANINQRAAKYAAQNTPNFAGTPGTLPTTVATFLEPGSRITELGCPDGEELHLIINRRMNDAYINARSVYFNPTDEISKTVKTGVFVDNTLGYTVQRDQAIYTQQIGTFAGTPVIDATSPLSADGGNNATMNLAISGFTGASGSNSLNYGDKFTIAGVYSVHPQLRASTGRLQVFTVLNQPSVVDVGGLMNVTVFPAITPPGVGTGQYQNVTAAAVVAADVFIWAGTVASPAASSGVTSVQGLVMHKDAFAFVSVPLAMPEGKGGDIEFATADKDPETGMWMSFIRAFDSKDRIWINRFDTLLGLARLYAAELSCVLAG